MIFDTIKGLKKYTNALPELEKVVELLDSGELDGKEAGAYSTDIPTLRYMINIYEPKEKRDNSFEYHKKEIDVQFMLKGVEKCAYSSQKGDLSKIDSENSDIAFREAESEEECILSEGMAVIYYPGELHKPGIKLDEGKVIKAVFKILYK